MKLRILLLTSLIFVFALVGCAQKEIGKSEPLQEKEKARSSSEPLQVGATAPDFTLPSQKDEKITLSKTNKLTVLVFYRGYW